MMEVGLLESIFHITSFVFEIPSGALADRFTYRTNLFLSRFFSIVSALIMIFAGSFWLFALGMMTNALSYNFNSGTDEAILYESVVASGKKGRFLKVNSFRSGLFELTLALGTMIAGLFVHSGMYKVYIISIALSLISILLIVLTKEPDDQVKQKSEQQTFGLIFSTVKKELKTNRGLFEVMVIFSLISSFLAIYYMYFQNQVAHLPGWKISLMMGVSTVVQVTFAWAAAIVGERFSVFKMIPFITSVSAILMLASFTNKFAVLLATFILTNGLYAMLVPIFDNYFNMEISSNVRATLISINSMLYSLSMIVVFPLTGFFIEKLNFAKVFGVLGVIMIVFAIVVKRKMELQEKQK
jgi:MFS family permease